MTMSTLGQAMRTIALRAEFWDELGDFGYLDGGCRIYAEAARAYFGAECELSYVVAEGGGIGPIVDHAVVIYADHAFDGDGATPVERYLEHYEQLEHRGEMLLELLPSAELSDDRDLARQARELPLNAALSSRLAAAWRAELGSPE